MQPVKNILAANDGGSTLQPNSAAPAAQPSAGAPLAGKECKIKESQPKITLVSLDKREAETIPESVATGMRLIGKAVIAAMLEQNLPVVHTQVFWKIEGSDGIQMSFCVNQLPPHEESFNKYANTVIADALRKKLHNAIAKGLYLESIMGEGSAKIATSEILSGGGYVTLFVRYDSKKNNGTPIEPAKNDEPKASLRLIAREQIKQSNPVADIFSGIEAGPLFLEKLIGGTLFPTQIANTELEGNREHFLWIVAISALRRFYGDIVDLGNEGQHLMDIVDVLEMCLTIEKQRTDALQCGGEKLLALCNDLTHKLLRLAPGKSLAIHVGYSDVMVGHSSYVIYVCSADGQSFEVYEINGYGLNPIDGGDGYINFRQIGTAPARYYIIPKDKLFPIIGRDGNGTEIRSVAHLFLMLKLENSMARDFQGYAKFLNAMWHGFTEYKRPIPRHMVELFVQTPNSGICAIRSLECLLLVQLAMRFDNPKDACNLARLFFFFVSMGAVNAYCEHLMHSSDAVGAQNYEILSRARTHLIFKKNKLTKMSSGLGPGENCPAVLVALAMKVLTKIDSFLEKHSYVTRRACPPPMPSAKSENFEKNANDLRLALKFIYDKRESLADNSMVLQNAGPKFSLFDRNGKNTAKEVMNYLQTIAITSPRLASLHPLSIHCLPMPWDAIWETLSLEESRMAFDLICDIECKYQSLWGKTYGATTRFFIAHTLFRLLVSGKYFFSDILSRYCIDNYVFRRIALRDDCILVDKDDVAMRNQLIEFGEKERLNKKTPTFFLYDGIGGTTSGGTWPITAEMRLWQEFLDEAERVASTQADLQGDDLFRAAYGAFISMACDTIERKNLIPSKCETWSQNLKIGGAIFCGNKKILSELEKFGSVCGADSGIKRLLSFFSYCRTFEQDTFENFADRPMAETYCQWKWDPHRQIFRFDRAYGVPEPVISQQTCRLQHKTEKLSTENFALAKEDSAALSIFEPLEAEPSLLPIIILQDLMQHLNTYFDGSRDNSEKLGRDFENLRRVLFKTMIGKNDCEIHPIIDAAKKDGLALLKLTQELWNAAFHNFYTAAPKKNESACISCLVLISEIRLAILKEHPEMHGNRTLALSCNTDATAHSMEDFLTELHVDSKDTERYMAAHMALWCDSLFSEDKKLKWKELFLLGIVSWNKNVGALENLESMIFSYLQLNPPQQSDICDILSAVSHILDGHYEKENVTVDSNLLCINKANITVDMFTWQIFRNGLKYTDARRPLVICGKIIAEIFGSESGMHLISKAEKECYSIKNKIFDNVRLIPSYYDNIFLSTLDTVERTDGNGNVLWRAIAKKSAMQFVSPAVLLDATAWISKDGNLEICDRSNGTPLFKTDPESGKLRKLTPPFAGTFVELTPLEADLEDLDDGKTSFDLQKVYLREHASEDLFSRFEAPGKYYFAAEKDGVRVGVVFPYYRDAAGRPLSFVGDKNGVWHSGSCVLDTVPADGNPLGVLEDAIVLRHAQSGQDTPAIPATYILPNAQIYHDRRLGRLRDNPKFKLRTDETISPVLQCHCCPDGGVSASDTESTIMLAYIDLAQCNYGAALARLQRINFWQPLSDDAEKIIENMCCTVYEYDSSAYAAAVALHAACGQVQSKSAKIKSTVEQSGKKLLAIGIFGEIFDNYLLDMESVPMYHRLSHLQELTLLHIYSATSMHAHKRKQALKALPSQNFENLNFPHVERKYTLMAASIDQRSDFRDIRAENVEKIKKTLRIHAGDWKLNETIKLIKRYEFRNMCTVRTPKNCEELGVAFKKFTEIYEYIRSSGGDAAEIQKRDIVFNHAITELLSSLSGQDVGLPTMTVALKVAVFLSAKAPIFPNDPSEENGEAEWLLAILSLADEYLAPNAMEDRSKMAHGSSGPRIPSSIRFYQDTERNTKDDDILAPIDKKNREELSIFYFPAPKIPVLKFENFLNIEKLKNIVYGSTPIIFPPQIGRLANCVSNAPLNFYDVASRYFAEELEEGSRSRKLRGQRIGLRIQNSEKLTGECATKRLAFVEMRDRIQKRLLENLNGVASGHGDDIADFRRGELFRQLTVTDAAIAAATYYAIPSSHRNHSVLGNTMWPLRRLNPGIDLNKSLEILSDAALYAKVSNAIATVDRVLAHVRGISQGQRTKDLATENFHRDGLFQELNNSSDVGNLDPEFCTLFEHLNGNIRLRNEQIEALNFSMDVLNGKRTTKDNTLQTKGVLQLRMGMGKTDIILPFLLFQVTVGQQQNARLCVDDTQIAAVQLQIEDRLRRLGLRLFTMPFTPKEWADHRQLQRVLEVIDANAAMRDIVFLQSAMSYRAMLNVYESLLPTPENPNLPSLAKIISCNFVEIVDEVQLSYSPYVSFASAAGPAQRIESAMLAVAEEIMAFMATDINEKTGICENNQSAHFNAKIYSEVIRQRLAERILKYFENSSEYRVAMRKEGSLVLQFLLGITVSDAPMPFNENFTKILWYTRSLLDRYVPDILRRKCGTDYGLDEKKERCVPYEKGQRSYGYFRDPITEIMLSMAVAIQFPLTESQLFKYVKQCIDDATIEHMLSSEEFDETHAAKKFFKVTKIHLKKFAETPTDKDNFLSSALENELRSVLHRLNGNDRIPEMDAKSIKARLEICNTISQCTFHTKFYEVNSAEIPMRSRAVLAMSGTPNNLSICPPEMQENLRRDPGAIGESICTFLDDLKNGNTIYFTIASRSAGEIFTNYVTKISSAKNGKNAAQSIGGILDMGALLPADMAQNAREIWKIIQGKMPYDGILFWDNAALNFSILRQADGGDVAIIPLRSIRDEDLSFAGIGDKRRLFVIYDQSHCTGTNIVGLRTDVRMLLLAEPASMTSDFLAQTLSRLRLYGIGEQRVDIAFSNVALDTWIQSNQKPATFMESTGNFRQKLMKQTEMDAVEEIKKILIASDAKRAMQSEERCVYSRCVAVCHSIMLNFSLQIGFCRFSNDVQMKIGNLFLRSETFTNLENFKNSSPAGNQTQNFDNFLRKNVYAIPQFTYFIADCFANNSNGAFAANYAFLAEIESIRQKACAILPGITAGGRGFGEAETISVEQNVEHFSMENRLLAAKQEQQRQAMLLQQQLKSFQVQISRSGFLLDLGLEKGWKRPTAKVDFGSYAAGEASPVQKMFCVDIFKNTSENATEYASYGALFPPSVKATHAFWMAESGPIIPVFSPLMRKCYAFALEKNGNITLLTQKQTVFVRSCIESGLFSGVRLYATAGWVLLEQSTDAQAWKIRHMGSNPLRFYVSLFNGDYGTILREKSHVEIDLSQHKFPSAVTAEQISKQFSEFMRLRSAKPVSISINFSKTQLESLKNGAHKS
ncbi:MAG: DUF3638 domain-containing protein [Puniceicoccales bacterium]|nr:DUF3638 domain-containing protein [Puniceicoccales bacterium]